MKVPLLDLSLQLNRIGTEIKTAINEVVDSTRYIAGPKVDALEQALADYTNTKHAVAVSSGTDALLVSMMALGVGDGDIVVTTPYSFFATAGCVARLNATPAFVDIDPETYNMDPVALRKWFEEEGDKRHRVKAIIPVHLFGQCADMQPIREVAAEYDVALIEDAAQALGSAYPTDGLQEKAGSMGTLGCFSFFPSKNLGALGDGGIVVTNDESLAEKLRRLRNHGAKPKYHHALIGGNFRLDPIQAAVLLVKLPYLDEWHVMRQENAAYYDKHLTFDSIKPPTIAYDRTFHIYNQYVISVSERRDELRSFLKANEIGCEVYYPIPFHEQECFRYLGYQTGDFPHSEYAAGHSLALPVYPEITTEMQEYVIEKLGGFCES